MSGAGLGAEGGRSAGGGTGGAPPPPPLAPTLSEQLTGALEAHRFGAVAEGLKVAIMTHRNPAAINWCVTFGYKHGVPCALYYLCRNVLKHREGRVCTVEDLAFGFQCAVLLLLRIGADVVAAREDMAKAGLEFVYTSVRDKLWTWLKPMLQEPHSASAPTLAQTHRELDSWLRVHRAADLPTPVWCTAFSTSVMFGNTFTFGDPLPHDVAAFGKSQGIAGTRARFASDFMVLLAGMPSWEALFSSTMNVCVG
jgi:hypothetical protein